MKLPLYIMSYFPLGQRKWCEQARRCRTFAASGRNIRRLTGIDKGTKRIGQELRGVRGEAAVHLEEEILAEGGVVEGVLEAAQEGVLEGLTGR